MRAYRPSGFDPRPHLAEIASPSLWIFGGRDPSVPVDRSIEVLEAIRRERGREITIRVFPEGNHLLHESAIGDRDEYPLLQRFVPGYLDSMVDWMRAASRRPR
jgi:pimeloyl-ACP methyl ester carboxylesterase